MSDLQRAIEIAVDAHRGQFDKAGAPYILHPLRVMQRQSTTDAMIVGVLHDVVEDSDWTYERLQAEGFSDAILNALKAVTNQPDEDYDAFVARAASNPIGRMVKLADIEDNLDVRRLTEMTERDGKRMNKYLRAWRRLQE